MARIADDLTQRLPGQFNQGNSQLVRIAKVSIKAVWRDIRLARHFAQTERGHTAMRPQKAQRGGDQILAVDARLAAGAVIEAWMRGGIHVIVVPEGLRMIALAISARIYAHVCRYVYIAAS